MIQKIADQMIFDVVVLLLVYKDPAKEICGMRFPTMDLASLLLTKIQ